MCPLERIKATFDNFSVPLGAWIPLPWQPKAGTHTVVFLCMQSHNISNQSCII